ncbi:hypothetical protein BR93DRAFT_930889 [Coniochaeta sp. PMI_546]|nr:hypothetical protein BR93DRAFT_930889 [Coniochaeta sp. PMI_546]
MVSHLGFLVFPPSLSLITALPARLLVLLASSVLSFPPVLDAQFWAKSRIAWANP